MKIKVTEAEVKKSVTEYLTLQQNMGRIVFHRLQSGSMLVNYGDRKHKVQFCDPGTADFVVLRGTISKYFKAGKCSHRYCQVTYLEIKSSTGKQSLEQELFQDKAERQGCRYFVVNDAGMMERIFGGTP